MISYLPKLNEVQRIYADKTSLMVPVGVDGGSEPTPEPEPTGSPIESVTLRCDGGTYWVVPRVAEWFDEEYADQLVAEQVVYTAYINDANGNSLLSPTEDIGIDNLCPRSDDEFHYGFVIETGDSGQLPTETGTYELRIWTDLTDWSVMPSGDPDFVATGEWTSVSC